jgi:hypothetical protein
VLFELPALRTPICDTSASSASVERGGEAAQAFWMSSASTSAVRRPGGELLGADRPLPAIFEATAHEDRHIGAFEDELRDSSSTDERAGGSTNATESSSAAGPP